MKWPLHVLATCPDVGHRQRRRRARRQADYGQIQARAHSQFDGIEAAEFRQSRTQPDVHTEESANQPDGHILTGILNAEEGEKLRGSACQLEGCSLSPASRALVEGREKDVDGWHLPEVSSVVEHWLTQLLCDRAQLIDWIQKSHPTTDLAAALDRSELLVAKLKANTIDTCRDLAPRVFRRVVLKPGAPIVELDRLAIVAALIPD